MKMSWILFALLGSSNAMAASLPSILPDGWYDVSCDDIEVVKYDAPKEGEPALPTPKGTDANGITRSLIHREGRSDFKTEGDTTTITESFKFKGSDFSGKTDNVEKRVIKSIGENLFEDQAVFTSKTTMDNSPSDPTADTDIDITKRTISVQGDFEVNVKVKNGDEPEAPGIGETVVTKEADGSMYTMTSYRRENVHQAEVHLPNGIVRPGKFVYQYTSVCKYKFAGPILKGG